MVYEASMHLNEASTVSEEYSYFDFNDTRVSAAYTAEQLLKKEKTIL